MLRRAGQGAVAPVGAVLQPAQQRREFLDLVGESTPFPVARPRSRIPDTHYLHVGWAGMVPPSTRRAAVVARTAVTADALGVAPTGAVPTNRRLATSDTRARHSCVHRTHSRGEPQARPWPPVRPPAAARPGLAPLPPGMAFKVRPFAAVSRVAHRPRRQGSVSRVCRAGWCSVGSLSFMAYRRRHRLNRV
jgi:hypothetical protein